MDSRLEKTVLTYPRLKTYIEQSRDPDNEREKTLNNLKEIKADFKAPVIKGFQRFLDNTLYRLYDSINYDDNVVDIKELVKDNCVVLVPNHQSHADYLAINYLFFKNYKIPLYVAGGVNLNIFPIGTIFRKSGCFFIRRSFASDYNYRLTLEAYLYFLLKNGKPIEFFFEGGRSRSGKLLPPRFGLYTMLLEAYREVKNTTKRNLIFVPVSIIHEYVPEQKSLAKEMGGGKKKKESTKQLLGLFRVVSQQFGSVHIRLGKPVTVKSAPSDDELKGITHNLAFRCFREVGKNMMVTPTSLLAMVLLDEPSGAMVWQDIMSKAKAVIYHCHLLDIPHTNSLSESKLEKSLERAMDIMIGNKKVDVIGKEHRGQLYYTIREESRAEILYFKNMILHHFLVPSLMSYAWIYLFNGEISSVDDLKKFFVRQRSQLKHEFYLPSVKEIFYKTMTIVSDAIGRKIGSLEELMELNHKELYQVAACLGPYTRALCYINEAYYVSSMALKSLAEAYPDGFKNSAYDEKARIVFEEEKELGRIIRYPESFSVATTASALQYLKNIGLVKKEAELLKIEDLEGLQQLISRYEKDLIDQLTINIRVTPGQG